jgi:hypothetical protein
MLDKLGRNKILLIFLVFIFACRNEFEKPGVYHTELICVDRDIILIRYTRLSEVRKAIIKAYGNKKKFKTSENYTVISLENNRSMRIEALLPEDAINCNLREIYHPGKDKFKRQYMETPGYDLFH